MSSLESNGGLRSILDRVLVSLLAAGITAIVAAGFAYVPSFFGRTSSACPQFAGRLDKIEDLPDDRTKLRRLNSLLATAEDRTCPTYDEAVNERDGLRAIVASDGVKTGRSVRVVPQPTPPPVPQPANAPARVSPVQAQNDPRVPVAPSPVSVPAVRNGPTDSDPGSAPPLVVAQHEPAKALPDIIVQRPTFSDPDVPFDGRISDELVMKQGARYELRPVQWNTLTYSVSKGHLIVEVDGKPYFDCGPVDAFRLYWQNKPDFVAVSTDDRSSIKITDIEAGKHLGTSSCLDAPG